jgi:TatD family-associated radical SAM protein
MGQIAYYCRDDKSRLYLQIVDRYKCTNCCTFCDKALLEDTLNVELYLKEKPGLSDILHSIDSEIKTSKVIPKDIIFCGIGEPTIYLDTILEVTERVKAKYSVKVRLDTNGQVYLIYPDREGIPSELKKAGVDTVSVSLNALTKEEYDKRHCPESLNAFGSVLQFARDCVKEGLLTHVSFIEFEGFDVQKAFKFLEENGLKDACLKLRQHLR